MWRVTKVRSYIIISFLVLAFAMQSAIAQDATGLIDELIVKTDPVGLLEERNSSSVFGIERPLFEIPRSISVVSNTTMERYGIEDINDFITTTPGTFGGSFFGVPGAISVRGRRGENYFRGFKRITNNGFFPLPVGASSRVEIQRGTVPAIYGAGRVGGFLNFYPKTAFSEGVTADEGVSSYVSYTGGSYDKKNMTAELTLPFLVGGRETGISVYGEYEDSKSFYIGREPEHKLLQFGLNHDLSNGMKVEFGGMYYDSEGYNQTSGWNRLTQELIDNRTYITGRDTDLVDLDGSGHITRNELDAAVGSTFGFSDIRILKEFLFGAPPAPSAPFDLDVGVGTTKLSRRNVVISDRDVWESENFTLYFDIIKESDNNSTFKLQFFYDDQDAKGANVTGFAAHHDMDVFEVRGSYEFSAKLTDFVNLEIFTTASHRTYDSLLQESFLAGYLVLDRLDLSVGATANDIIDNPFSVEAGGINAPWDSQFKSKWTDTGIALVTDLHLWENLGILFNGRYDQYHYESIDLSSTAPQIQGNEGDFSWSISSSYITPWGVVPYVTYAQGSEALINSNGGVSPGTIATGSILTDSELFEIGFKFSILDDTLYGTFAYFDQENFRRDSFGNVDQEISDGFEAELNYLFSGNWSLTGAATIMEVNIADPDPTNCGFGFGSGEFLALPPPELGVAGTAGFGGIFGVLNASCLPQLADGYKRKGIPKEVYSLFVTYTSDETDYGTFGATFGGTYVSKTGTLPIANAVVFPNYTTYRLALFVEYNQFNLTAKIDNLFDKKYFTPLQGVYQNVSALPGEGRIWRLTGKINF